MNREIHFHVEEPSMEAFLEELLPRLHGQIYSFKIINHQNKQRLLREIPRRLAGYNRIPRDYRPLTLVLVDRDDSDCHDLKKRLELAAQDAGLSTKSATVDGSFDVVNRIVVEELEAWHFGDTDALRAEFPGVPNNLENRATFRNPDAILGGTHEALLRVLQSAGHHVGLSTLPKIDTARRLGQRANPDGNRSSNFQHFRMGLEALIAQIQQANQNHG